MPVGVNSLPPPTVDTDFRVASFVIPTVVASRTVEEGTNDDTQGSMFVLTWFEFGPLPLWYDRALEAHILG